MGMGVWHVVTTSVAHAAYGRIFACQARAWQALECSRLVSVVPPYGPCCRAARRACCSFLVVTFVAYTAIPLSAGS